MNATLAPQSRFTPTRVTPAPQSRSTPTRVTPAPTAKFSPRPAGRPPGAGKPATVEAKILFQKFFKSVGPRTYAAQLKEAGNGNQFIVLTEGKRDDKTGEPRKTRLFIFSEDFDAFFKLVDDLGEFARAHPVTTEVKSRQKAYWAKKARTPGASQETQA